jgi:hypothetical protein
MSPNGAFMARHQSATGITGKIEIEVIGSDLDGLQFIEHTRILTINEDGATIPLANKLAPDSELIVRNALTKEEAVARVVGLIRDDICVHVYGIAFVDPSVNLWNIDFPRAQAEKIVIMECIRCHAVETVSLSEIEAKIVELKQSLTRRCKCINSSTIWKQTDRETNERRKSDQRNIPSLDETAARVPLERRREERRRDKRTAMKISACIRFSGREVAVECEDVSRGGFRFKSRKAYPAGTPIEAAVPYLKSSVNIFVACQIAYQHELSSGLYRHGVAYVSSISQPDSRP